MLGAGDAATTTCSARTAGRPKSVPRPRPLSADPGEGFSEPPSGIENRCPRPNTDENRRPSCESQPTRTGKMKSQSRDRLMDRGWKRLSTMALAWRSRKA